MKDFLNSHLQSLLYLKTTNGYYAGFKVASVDEESFTIKAGETLVSLKYTDVQEIRHIPQIEHCSECGKALVMNWEFDGKLYCHSCYSKRNKPIKKFQQRLENLHIIPAGVLK